MVFLNGILNKSVPGIREVTLQHLTQTISANNTRWEGDNAISTSGSATKQSAIMGSNY
jgi:hypothetical protein